jgi:DNA polymerase III delta prime subunit
VSISGGDLRKAITTLQSVSSLYDEKEVTEDAIVEVAGVRAPGEPPQITPFKWKLQR